MSALNELDKEISDLTLTMHRDIARISDVATAEHAVPITALIDSIAGSLIDKALYRQGFNQGARNTQAH